MPISNNQPPLWARILVSRKFWLAILALLVVFIFLPMVNPFVSVPSGHRGVITTFGKVTSDPLDEGLHLVWPWRKVTPVQVRMLKSAVKGDAASKDLQQVTTEIALNYHLEPQLTPLFYQMVGLGYEAVIIAPAVEETFKAITANYTAEELIVKRDEVRTKIRAMLSQRLRERSGGGLIVDDFSVTNFAFSGVFNRAIEAKSEAEQLALKAQRDLVRIKVEAEQKISQAQAEASALRMQKQEVTPELIKLRELEVQREAIKKWDGKLPQYSGGAVPFLNLNK